MKTVIAGSFRKHLPYISQAIQQMQASDIVVLAPAQGEAIDSDAEFVRLVSDSTLKHPYQLEKEFMSAIEEAVFLYIANAKGYIGLSAASEMAYAYLKKVPVIVSHEIMHISEDVSENFHTILTQIPKGILPIEAITKGEIERIVKLGHTEVSPEIQDSLVVLVETLLNDLKNKYHE